MSERGKWQGMLTIARFNWPLYLAALVALLVAVCGVFCVSSMALKLACGAALLGAVYFVFGSLGVSHLIYDRSDLYRWNWLARALNGAERRAFIFCHSGFDECSQALREKFADAQWQMLDHYEAARMTEPSIRRARRLYPPTPGTVAAAYDDWPVEAGSADVVFGILAIHEFRTEDERTAWFAEARRCLQKGGRVVLVEHLRDTANFLAFGPGFLHFHSRQSWQRAWASAGLVIRDEFCITPWVRVFILTTP